MDILKSWKDQNGYGTYFYNDREDVNRVLEYLVLNIKKMNNDVSLFTSGQDVVNKMNLLNIATIDYENCMRPSAPVFLLILHNVTELNDDMFNYLINANPSKYIFCTADKNTELSETMSKIVPKIGIVKTNNIRNIAAVKRNIYNVAIDLSTDDQHKYDELTKQMNEIFSFFDGDLYILNGCYRGDNKIGKTADIFRREFATKMGWSETLDTSIEYFKDVEKYYNPNNIYEQAKLYNRLSADRNHMIDEHLSKAYFVHKLVEYNEGKRFLVICRNSVMADLVYQTIEKYNKRPNVSRPIHPDLEPVHFKDTNGEYITYKTGAKKGQLKEFGAVSQVKTYVDWFNADSIKVLISSNAVMKGILLKEVDAVIFLSPKCLSYNELDKRIDIKMSSNINIVNAYLTGTSDQIKLEKIQSADKYSVKNFYRSDLKNLIFN